MANKVKYSNTSSYITYYISEGSYTLDGLITVLNNILTKKIIFKLKFPKNIGEKLKSGLVINYPKPDLISITYNKNENKIEEIISEVKEKNLEILDILTEDADLEDVFLKLTKKNV